VSSVVGTSMTY